jgi:hypothetical protein
VRFQRLLRMRGGKLGHSSRRAAGLFRHSFQRRLVCFHKGGGDRAVRLEDRFGEAGRLRARVPNNAAASKKGSCASAKAPR